MIDRINFQSANIVNNQSLDNTLQKETPNYTYPQTKGITSETSGAARAYATPLIKNKLKPQSLNYYITKLKQEGKVEGKDYLITRAQKYDNYNLDLFDKNGNKIKTLYWCNGNDKNNYSGYNELLYSNNKEIKSIARRDDNKVTYYTNTYYNDEIPQTSFTKEGITSETTPQEYEKYLKQNNKNYEIGYTDDNWVFIDEFDENNKKKQSTVWIYGDEPIGSKLVSPDRNIYNSDGKECKRITFSKDKTEVCTYLNISGKKILPN